MATPTKQYRYLGEREGLVMRVKRIEGQVRGVRRMIEEGRYCVDIVQQIWALCAAADGVALELLRSHIEGCVADAIKEGGGEEYIRELMEVLRKALRR